MHDIDQTMPELEGDEGTEMEFEEGLELEDEFESGGDSFGEYEFEEEFEATDRVLSDAEEMEMASDLLSVSSDAELEQFLGSLFKKITRKVGGFFKRGIGRRLFGGLKKVAKVAVPWVGRAVGAKFGGPAGAMWGGKLAPMLGRIFGLELEGLSPEDQELEAAKRVVRSATRVRPCWA